MGGKCCWNYDDFSWHREICSSCIDTQDPGATKPKTSNLLPTAECARAASLLATSFLMLFKEQGKGKRFAAFFSGNLLPAAPQEKGTHGHKTLTNIPKQVTQPEELPAPLFCPQAQTWMDSNHESQAAKSEGLKHLKSRINSKTNGHSKEKCSGCFCAYFRKSWCLQRLFFPLDIVSGKAWPTLWAANEWTVSQDNHSKSKIFLVH